MTLTIQSLIDSGAAWRLEGAVGREAMEALQSGRCVLPEERHQDFFGNIVPSRHDVVDAVGSPGSLANHQAWLGAQDDYFADDLSHDPPCEDCGNLEHHPARYDEEA